MAASADLVVLVLGTDLSIGMENRDAVNITFSEGQLALVDAVTAAVSSPLIAVTLTATPLDLTPLLANPKIGAVLHAGQPSVQTLGVADIIFGRRSPAGRLVQTIYPVAYQHAVSIFDFNMRPGPSLYPRPDCADGTPAEKCPLGSNPGRTYRFYNGATGQAVLPFGFGLSYTTWSYDAAEASGKANISLDPLRTLLASTRAAGHSLPSTSALSAAVPLVSYRVTVTNTGEVDADDVVLGFLVPPNAGADGAPLQSLFGFERVHVAAGSSADVWLYPTLADFSHTARDGSQRAADGEWTVRFGVRQTAPHGQGFAELRLVAI